MPDPTHPAPVAPLVNRVRFNVLLESATLQLDGALAWFRKGCPVGDGEARDAYSALLSVNKDLGDILAGK